MAPVHCAAGSDGEINFGVTLLAAPNAALSRDARYSLIARLAVSGALVFFHSLPGIDRCLLASAAIRLASTAKPSPLTSPAAMQVSTTVQKPAGTRRSRENAHDGRARTLNGPAPCLQWRARKTTDR